MLRKLFLFALTSGLAKKAFDAYVGKQRRAASVKWRPDTPVPRVKSQVVRHRAG